ncbi:MAG: NAD(P)-binding domain-containing protein, partial [Desulfocucumaceae bacterium]
MYDRPLFNRVAIIGVGLIGGSLGLAINRKSMAGEIIGIGRSRETLELAVEYGAINSYAQDLSAVSGCDLIIIAT